MNSRILVLALTAVALVGVLRTQPVQAQEPQVWMCVSFGLHFHMTDSEPETAIRRLLYLRPESYGLLCPWVTEKRDLFDSFALQREVLSKREYNQAFNASLAQHRIEQQVTVFVWPHVEDLYDVVAVKSSDQFTRQYPAAAGLGSPVLLRWARNYGRGDFDEFVGVLIDELVKEWENTRIPSGAILR